MRLLFAILLAIAAISVTSKGLAQEEVPPSPPATPLPTVDLYTIGPHSDFPSRLGHVLICVREAGHDDAEHGRCVDYGVPESEDMLEVGWTAMRGIPSFRPIGVAEASVIHFFSEHGRQIEKQRLPLTAEETTRLVSALDRDVKEGVPYAYHPYWANCTTRIRDRIDEATNGKLRPGPSIIPPGTLREYLEEGNSGHIDILTAMAVYFGEGNDHVPTPWEAMLIPAILRDGVTERFGAKPEKLTERLEVIVPTSRALGRITLFALAFGLFAMVRICARKGRLRLAMGIYGGLLGLLAVSAEVLAALVKWTELSHNWALLLLWPTDFALPFLKGRLLTLYLKARVGIAIIVALLEIMNVAHQPMLQLVVLVALPCLGILSVLKARSTEANVASPEVAKTA